MQHAHGFPRCHWTSLPGECLRPIARAAAMVINVAYGPMADKTKLFAYLLHRKRIVGFCDGMKRGDSDEIVTKNVQYSM
jgi:hypothetical protein